MELLKAAKTGNLNEVRLLLQRGDDVNIRDPQVCHPLSSSSHPPPPLILLSSYPPLILLSSHPPLLSSSSPLILLSSYPPLILLLSSSPLILLSSHPPLFSSSSPLILLSSHPPLLSSSSLLFLLPAVISAPLLLCVVGVVLSRRLVLLHSHSRSNHLQFFLFSWFIIILALPLHSWLYLLVYSLIGFILDNGLRDMQSDQVNIVILQ
jgi:hypothetical protein